jgi:N,N'-diacetyllegionaminate synthase
MRFNTIDADVKVFVIAEVGNNHEGSYSLAEEMIGRAAEAGADAVKFQTFVPEHYVSSSDAARLERLRRFQLSYEQFAKLAKHAASAGVIFFSTPFDLESARFLDTIQSIFKIASGDNTFVPLIETVAGFRKPMIVSTGLADMTLLKMVHEDIRRIWAGADPGLVFLHCVSSYPVPLAQANIGAIPALIAAFPDCTIGYSDHTLGIKAAIHAVSAGARVIEKHFTLNKNFSDFRDHQLSADPGEMRILVEEVREVSQLMGSREKVVQACEEGLRTAVRRSIGVARDLPIGTTLRATDLTWIRPGTGIAPGEEYRVLGHKTKRALKKGELIPLEAIEPS